MAPGESEPAIDCIDDYDHFFADRRHHARRSGGAAAAGRSRRGVHRPTASSKNAAFYQYVGTNNSARDIDAIRAALGEATISYFGFSYGSELGGTWATLFPTTVRAAVFDGAVDPNVGRRRERAAAGQGLRGLADTRFSRPAVPTGSARSTTAATQPARSTTDEVDRRVTDSELGGPAARQSGGGVDRRGSGDVLGGELAAVGTRRSPMPRTATAPVCSSCTTSTTCAARTARRRTRWRRSR